jgi:hypothetical protein
VAKYSRTGTFNQRQLSTTERIAATFGPPVDCRCVSSSSDQGTGRIEFSARLLRVPCKGTLSSPVKIRAGKLSLQPETLGADQEVTNDLKHFEKESR